MGLLLRREPNEDRVAHGEGLELLACGGELGILLLDEDGRVMEGVVGLGERQERERLAAVPADDEDRQGCEDEKQKYEYAYLGRFLSAT